jgi:type IV pilus assembly protein PilV
MLEVMVSVFVLAVGLLGLASLQAFSIRGSASSEHRSQAVLVAYDIVDRMRSNQAAALAGAYNIELDDDIPTGDDAPPLADDDLANWFGSLLALLPAGDASINCDNTGRCTVVIQWDDSRAEVDAEERQFIFTSDIAPAA